MAKKKAGKAGKPATLSLNGILDKPSTEMVIREWKLHLERGGPTFMVSVFLEWMRDPGNHARRLACTEIMSFIAIRSWKEVLASLKDRVEAEMLAGLDTPEAEQFYDKFKVSVKGTIEDYWNEFAKKKSG